MTDIRCSSGSVEALARILMRCRTVLGNMAWENEGRLAMFNRWPISHEPLRADAKNLVPLIDEVLAAHHTEAMEGFTGAQCSQVPVAYRIYCTTNGATGYLYTEVLPFDAGPGVRVRREPEPLYAVTPSPGPGEPREKEITRLATIEECADIVEGQIVHHNCREWPAVSSQGNRASDDPIVQHCDKLAAAIRTLALTSTQEKSP